MKVLICYPFDPSLGASGRKEGAINSFEAMHRMAGIEFERLYLSEVLNDAELTSSNSELGSRIIRTLARSRSTLLRSISAALVTRKVVREGGFNACTIYGLTVQPIIAGVFIAKWNRLPYFVYEHRSYYAELRKNRKEPSRFIRWALPRARGVMCLSRGHRSDIQHHFPGLNPKILLIPPYEIDDLSNLSCRDDLRVSGAFTIGAWTNWREIKRLDVLVEAFCRFAEGKDDVSLKIAGPVPENPTNQCARQRVTEVRRPDQIKFLGPLERSEILALSCECDVAAISSDYESYGLPAVEALIVGTPVVITNCSGPTSFVDHGKNGFVVPTNDPAAMARAFEAIFKNQEVFRRDHISSAASSDFSIRGQARVLAQIYQA